MQICAPLLKQLFLFACGPLVMVAPLGGPCARLRNAGVDIASCDIVYADDIWTLNLGLLFELAVYLHLNLLTVLLQLFTLLSRLTLSSGCVVL